MATIRQEKFFRTDSLISAESIDLDTHDCAGRFDGVSASLCGSNESPQFIFLTGCADDGEVVSVAFLGHGQMSLRLAGSGSAGAKLTTNSSGHIVASDTAADAKLASKDFGIAREDWSDGDETLCEILTGAK